MSDWDDKKFVKSQAIENNDGLTILSLEQLSVFAKDLSKVFRYFIYMVRFF